MMYNNAIVSWAKVKNDLYIVIPGGDGGARGFS